MSGYCPMLQSNWVLQQRAHYAELDSQTPMEGLLEELVTAGELPNPAGFDITTVCAGLH
jgi:hypothetical protein